MSASHTRFTLLAAALAVGFAVHGCKAGSMDNADIGEEEAGGTSNTGKGGKKGTSAGGKEGGEGGASAGGAKGEGGKGEGGETAMGGSGSGGTMGEGGAVGSGGTTGEGGATGMGGGAGSGSGEAPDGGIRPPDATSGVLACWPDPKVIKICHQLENACENCGPLKGTAPPKNKLAQPCFDLVAKAYKGEATDQECADFAVKNDCTVDNVTTTGNVCGSLNCYAPGCKDKARCLNRQQWGDSSMCTQFMATCPCK
jgi:hypothetical protein